MSCKFEKQYIFSSNIKSKSCKKKLYKTRPAYIGQTHKILMKIYSTYKGYDV